jgi:hypothetical protein
VDIVVNFPQDRADQRKDGATVRSGQLLFEMDNAICRLSWKNYVSRKNFPPLMKNVFVI